MHRLASRSLLSVWLICLFIATVLATSALATSALAKPRTKRTAAPKPIPCGVIPDPFWDPPVLFNMLDFGPPELESWVHFKCDAGQRSECGMEIMITINDVEITYETVNGTCGNNLSNHQKIEMGSFPRGQWLCRIQVWDSWRGNKLYPDQFVLYVVH